MPISATDGEAGFTLVEAICALAILSLALVSLLQALGGAERNASRLADSRAARIVAENVLDGLGAAPRIAQTGSGRSGKFAWSVLLQPDGDTARGDRWRLYRVRIDVAGPRGNAHVETYRVLPPS